MILQIYLRVRKIILYRWDNILRSCSFLFYLLYNAKLKVKGTFFYKTIEKDESCILALIIVRSMTILEVIDAMKIIIMISKQEKEEMRMWKILHIVILITLNY